MRLTYVRRMAQRIAKFFILTKGTGINLFYFYLCLSFSLIHKKYFREKEKFQSNFIKNKNKTAIVAKPNSNLPNTHIPFISIFNSIYNKRKIS